MWLGVVKAACQTGDCEVGGLVWVLPSAVPCENPWQVVHTHASVHQAV